MRSWIYLLACNFMWELQFTCIKPVTRPGWPAVHRVGTNDLGDCDAVSPDAILMTLWDKGAAAVRPVSSAASDSDSPQGSRILVDGSGSVHQFGYARNDGD